MRSRVLRILVGALSVLLLSSLAGAQDLDVPGNLTMVSSTETQGNILKDGIPFLHDFPTGIGNTFLGLLAGNLTLTGGSNTGVGGNALSSNADGVANTATGAGSLGSNTSGNENTACGHGALFGNITGNGNTAVGNRVLFANTSGSDNTAIGTGADVAAGDLTNATAIGAGTLVDASNKIRLGNGDVTVIEGAVGFTSSSDRYRKENFLPVDGEQVLTNIRGLSLTSWNFIGQDPKQFRHYGPMAQDFFASFGRDDLGTIGTDTTITSTDIDGILLIAAQALEKRGLDQVKQIEALRSENAKLRGRLETENADLKARLEALERRLR